MWMTLNRISSSRKHSWFNLARPLVVAWLKCKAYITVQFRRVPPAGTLDILLTAYSTLWALELLTEVWSLLSPSLTSSLTLSLSLSLSPGSDNFIKAVKIPLIHSLRAYLEKELTHLSNLITFIFYFPNILTFNKSTGSTMRDTPPNGWESM